MWLWELSVDWEETWNLFICFLFASCFWMNDHRLSFIKIQKWETNVLYQQFDSCLSPLWDCVVHSCRRYLPKWLDCVKKRTKYLSVVMIITYWVDTSSTDLYGLLCTRWSDAHLSLNSLLSVGAQEAPTKLIQRRINIFIFVEYDDKSFLCKQGAASYKRKGYAFLYIYIYSAFAGSHDMAKIRLKTVVSFKKRKRMHFVIW